MIGLGADLLRDLVGEARLAPSVHNIQPTRWRLAGPDRILLLGDVSRAIPVADPAGRDWRLSHGTAAEGLALALAARGLSLAAVDVAAHSRPGADGLAPIAECRIAAASETRAEASVRSRSSWRGGFAPPDADVAQAVSRFVAAGDDRIAVTDRRAVAAIAELGDRAGLHFLRQRAHRAELLAWMRLSRAHPDFARDGLNAEAMALSRPEAFAAGLVLGPLFPPLDAIGLAAPLLSEAGKTASAAAVVLFHRPAGEDAFASGRAFYRVWLEADRCGLRGCPISVLADWPASRDRLAQMYGVPAGRALVGVFRFGRPDRAIAPRHARLPVAELIV